MDYFFFFTGSFVVFIFLFKKELLVDAESLKVILAVSVTLFISGLALHFTEVGHSMSGALLGPLLTLGLFHVCRQFFLHFCNREPKDTFLNFGKGLAADRLFNITYGVLAMFLLMFVTAVMWELAKAGW